jgi:hypothetical protein
MIEAFLDHLGERGVEAEVIKGTVTQSAILITLLIFQF